MVASALVGSPFLEDFAKSEEHFGSPSSFFSAEIRYILKNEIKVGLVFLGGPTSDSKFFLIGLKTHFFNLMIFWLKRFLI